LLSAHDDAPPRVACFHAHLAAETALKAWLIRNEQPFRKVHDLTELHSLVTATRSSGIDKLDLDLLNPWVIEGRYPGDVPEASGELALECVAAAERVVTYVEGVVGVSGGEAGA
jgi:HEPN domain-containing protein